MVNKRSDDNAKKVTFISSSVIVSIVAVILFLSYIGNRKPSNAILIIIDSLRPDHLSCYGYKRTTTKNIDYFADGGTLFTQVIAQGPQTRFSLPSIMSSDYLHSHVTAKDCVWLNPSIPTLAEVLKKHKYQTAAFCGSYLKYILPDIDRGFDFFVEEDNAAADKITKQALGWLKQNGRKPFFLWLHYFDPHIPYNPPAPYDRLYLTDNLYLTNKILPLGKDGLYPFGVIRSSVAQANISNVDYYISKYDGEINFTDEQIGILLSGVKKLKLDKNTLIIITADHGELLGEHNIYFTHTTLYDVPLKIPLIIRLGEIKSKNRVINYQVKSIDIMPTILDALKIKGPKGLKGTSLLPAILGKGMCGSVYVLSESGLEERAVRTESLKLIYQRKIWPSFSETNDYEYELYDLKGDSEELHNLSSLNSEELQFLKQKLVFFEENRVGKINRNSRPLDQDKYKALKSLGYVQ